MKSISPIPFLLACAFFWQEVALSNARSHPPLLTKPTTRTAKTAATFLPRGGAIRPKKTKTVATPTTNSNQPGKASILTSVFNLANNVAGAGILTLAAGKAVSGTGWIPSILTCIVLAFGSAHTFTLIGKACELTGETTFKGLWARAFGPKTAWIVDSMVFTQCFFVSIIYTGLLGDIFSALLGPTNVLSNYPFFKSRTGVILTAAGLILWPLNMIRDLSALGFTSILGLVAVLYTVFFMVVRALDGTYSVVEPVGTFVASVALRDSNVAHTPAFTKSTLWNFDLNTLVLISNLGLAYISHYNGPAYWQSLAGATSQRFSKVALFAYAILACIYTTTMMAGYATFGDVCQGNILLNYSPDDLLSTLGRLATGLSIIFGFPLISNGAREGLKNASSALGNQSISNPKNHILLVTCLLVTTTALSITLSDIKLVAGLTGAVMGSSLVYICPTLIYARTVQQCHGVDSLEYRQARRNLLFIPFGIFTASMGVAMTLKNVRK